MKKLLREFFFLRRGEKRALLIVLILLVFIMILRNWLALRPIQGFEPDAEFMELVLEFKEKIAIAEFENTQAEEELKEVLSPTLTIRPFTFDPNTINADSLKLMNLPASVVKNIISYRNSGGIFRKPADLAKIYGLDSMVYEKIHPYLKFSIQPTKSSANLKREFELKKIEINSADSAVLMTIPGIGPSSSKRIIKYRNMLGGYYDIDQLWEVYGMDSIRYLALERYCTFDSSFIVRIELNNCSFSELISHPYISKAETYAIMQFRDYMGKINHIEELESEQIIDHERFKRVRPYLFISPSE